MASPGKDLVFQSSVCASILVFWSWLEKEMPPALLILLGVTDTRVWHLGWNFIPAWQLCSTAGGWRLQMDRRAKVELERGPGSGWDGGFPGEGCASSWVCTDQGTWSTLSPQAPVPSIPRCWWLQRERRQVEFSWNFLNRCSLGRTDQCWQNRSRVCVFNVVSSTPFRPGHLLDLLVFSVIFLGAGCLLCHFPWNWMWRGRIHSLCVGNSAFQPCCIACLSSFLALPFK